MKKIIPTLSLSLFTLLLGTGSAVFSNEIESENIIGDADRNYQMYHRDYQYGSFRSSPSTPHHGGNYNHKKNKHSNDEDSYNDDTNNNYNSKREQHSNNNARYYYRNS